MTRRFGPASPFDLSFPGVAAGVLLAPLSASPAAAEVCDKAEGGFGGWLGLVLVLATFAFASASAFGRLWPAVVAAAIMGLLTVAGLADLFRQDPFALAAWREGCGRSNLALDAFAALVLIMLGFVGRRRFRARTTADDAGGPTSSIGRT